MGFALWNFIILTHFQEHIHSVMWGEYAVFHNICYYRSYNKQLMVEIIKSLSRVTTSDWTARNPSRKSVLSKLILNVILKVFAVHKVCNKFLINNNCWYIFKEIFCHVNKCFYRMYANCFLEFFHASENYNKKSKCRYYIQWHCLRQSDVSVWN